MAFRDGKPSRPVVTSIEEEEFYGSDTKLRPVSLLLGFFMGSISYHLPEAETKDLARLVASNPLTWFATGGIALESIRYIDHKRNDVPKDEVLSNCKTGFMNYTAGYFVGYLANGLVKMFS